MTDLHSEVSAARRLILTELALAAPPGDILEVGVFKGGTARALERAVAQRPGCRLWLYDTFGPGLPYCDPDKGDFLEVGRFAGGLTADEAQVLFPHAIVQAGVFPSEHTVLPRRVAFAHLDVDQYRSYRDAFAVLFPVMVPGGVIFCDDYLLAGCARAVHEARDAGHVLEFASDGAAMFRT